MGAYLSKPITDKVSSDEVGKNVAYGASSMQGWRIQNEVSVKFSRPHYTVIRSHILKNCDFDDSRLTSLQICFPILHPLLSHKSSRPPKLINSAKRAVCESRGNTLDLNSRDAVQWQTFAYAAHLLADHFASLSTNINEYWFGILEEVIRFLCLADFTPTILVIFPALTDKIEAHSVFIYLPPVQFSNEESIASVLLSRF